MTAWRLITSLTVAMGFGGILSNPSQAADVAQRLVAESPFFFDEFGKAVAIAGDKVLVAAPFDDVVNLDGGAVYVFDLDSGELMTQLTNPFPNDGDYFGQSLAYSNDYFVVGVSGATLGEPESGGIMLFDADTFQFERSLWVPGTPASYVGHSVDVVGDLVVTGAFKEDGGGASKSGSAYVLDINTGDVVWHFINPEPAAEDFFGEAIAADESFVIAGTQNDDTKDIDAGAAYVYDLATGQLQHSLYSPRPSRGGVFGWEVDAANGKVLVGAPGDSELAAGAGAAFLFDSITGELVRTFENPDPNVSDHFGEAVKLLENGMVLVGSTAGREPGSVYLFDGESGLLLDQFAADTPESNDRFGDALDVVGTHLLIGAPHYNSGVPAAGGAFLYDLDPALFSVAGDLNQDGSVDAADAALLFSAWATADPLADINADGIVDAADASSLFTNWTGDASAVSVPEPQFALAWLLFAFLLVAGTTRSGLLRRHAMACVKRR